MNLTIKVDENLPAEISAFLRSLNFDASSVHEQSLTGTRDEDLWPIVQRERRCLFTADKGFADIRAFPPGSHHGIVLFRLPRESLAGYIRLVESAIDRLTAENLTGVLAIVRPDGVRFYRPVVDESGADTTVLC